MGRVSDEDKNVLLDNQHSSTFNQAQILSSQSFGNGLP
jgi:hypothetical protein